MPAPGVARAAAVALLIAAVRPEVAGPQTPVAYQSVRDAQIAPDGGSVTFSRTSADSGGRLRINLWRVPFAGGDPQPLTSAETEDWHPRWSPDGRQLAFLSRTLADRAAARVFMLPATGGEGRAVTPEREDVMAFAWSPDSRRITYLLADRRRLSTVDVASGRAERAVLADVPALAFCWAADGSAIAALTENGVARIALIDGTQSPRLLAADAHALPELACSRHGLTIAWLTRSAPNQPVRIMTGGQDGDAVREVSIAGEGSPRHLEWRGDGRLSVVFSNGRETWVDLVDPAGGPRITVMPRWIAVLTSAPSWSADGTKYAVTGRTDEHPPEVFAGSLPLPESSRPDTVGAMTPPVRRLTISNR